jgi:hypothetical protein
LGRPEALPGFVEVVHRLFEDGVFVGHDQSIRLCIYRSLDCFSCSGERAEYERKRKEKPPTRAAVARIADSTESETGKIATITAPTLDAGATVLSCKLGSLVVT